MPLASIRAFPIVDFECIIGDLFNYTNDWLFVPPGGGIPIRQEDRYKCLDTEPFQESIYTAQLDFPFLLAPYISQCKSINEYIERRV